MKASRKEILKLIANPFAVWFFSAVLWTFTTWHDPRLPIRITAGIVAGMFWVFTFVSGCGIYLKAAGKLSDDKGVR